MSKSVKHLTSIGVNDEWTTPPFLLRWAMLKFDVHPFLDVCATAENAQFQDFFTKEQDGLAQDWKCDFFMNPPYSEISKWIEKASNEVQKHKVTGLILTFAKTDTRWWHDYIEDKHEVHFIKGRIKFLLNGQPKNSAPYPSCFIVMRGTT